MLRSVTVYCLLLLLIPLSLGDNSLRYAFNSAIAEMKRDGSFVTSLSLTFAAGGFVHGDCAGDPALFPYPIRTPGTHLDTVLSKKLLLLGDVTGSSTPLEQQAKDFWKPLLAKINGHYGTAVIGQVQINLLKYLKIRLFFLFCFIFFYILKVYSPLIFFKVVFFPTSATTLDALLSGALDTTVPFFSPAGRYSGVARTFSFDFSCITQDSLGTIAVKTNSPLNSFADILATPNLVSATNGEGSLILYRSVMPNVRVDFFDISLADLVVKLRSTGSNAIQFLVIAKDELVGAGISITGLRFFPAIFDNPSVMLFRPDSASCAPKPSRCCV